MSAARSLAAAAAAALLAALPAACGSPRRGEPIAGAFAPTDDAVRRGRLEFQRHCDACHPGGEPGLGPGLNEKPLPVFLMKFQVRHGLGAMPPFDEDAISDDALDDLMEFVVAYRRHD